MRRLSLAFVCFLSALALPSIPTATRQTAPYPGAPACTHDPIAYHGLWDPAQGCHYDHTHGANPHDLDDVFGTTLYALMGGTEGPGHLRQTFSALGPENAVKHYGYYWHVKRDIALAPGQTRGISAFRVLAHQHARLDAAVQYHSGVFEALVFDQAIGYGYIRIPGLWIDFGDLMLDGQPRIQVGDTNRVTGAHRQHGTMGTPQIIWYGASDSGFRFADGRKARGFVSISTSVHDVWTYTNAADPTQPGPFACADPSSTLCSANATLTRPHLIMVHFTRPQIRAIVDPDGNGVADWSGFTDRYGVPTATCAPGANSLDCVPVVISNIAVAGANYACDVGPSCAGGYSEHDVFFDGRSAGWSQPGQ